MRKRKHLVRWAAVLLAFGLIAAACGDDDDDDDAGSATSSEPAGTDVAGDDSDGDEMDDVESASAGLADVCPSPLVIQTDWNPESEHGSLYNLIGDDYELDTENKVVEGTMVLDGVDLGIRFQVRAGGPAIGFAPVSSHMYTDDSIHLGYATTDGQILRWADAPLLSVVAPLEQNPQMIMWDPETYPNVESIADLGEENVTINVFGGGTFSQVFVAQGIWNPNQVDPSYNGQPAAFIAANGSIAQQGFASAEVFTYENVFEEWGRPVNYQTLHDAGFQVYSQTIGIRAAELEDMRPCLERVVPVFQQSVVSYSNSPDRANAIIIDAVEQYETGWVYTPELADYAVRTMREIGLVGNGPDNTVGNMEADRIQGVFDQILATDLAADVAAGLSAEDIYTNEFIDPSIGFASSPGQSDNGSAAADDDDMMRLGDGSLGVVTVESGDAIQIRSLQAITGDNASFGLPIDRAAYIAVDDFGPVHGFDVDLGASLDDLCSNDGGQAAAQIIVADEDVVGVLGTSCSGAAVAAAPLITDAGMVLISGGNTSPALTSDLAGTAGPNHVRGYYRTAHNDLYQGAAMADFVFNELSLATAAAIHDGDPYTQGLAQAFSDAYEELGGNVTGFTAVNKEDTDMIPVLTELATGSPEALFFPIFRPAGDFVAEQAPGVSGLEDTVLLAADGLLNASYLPLPQTRGMYFSGPDQRFGENVNESTGKTAADFTEAYQAAYGEVPSSAFWAHGYDATTLLLEAIKAASWIEDDHLMIDRQGVRDFLYAVRGYEGIIGTLNCDDFGDCGAARITVVRNLGGESEEEIQASLKNVVFSYEPS